MKAPEKILAYAYPTSTNAALLGFAKTGCWYVGKEAFATRAEVIAYGETLPGDWGWFSMTNPRFAEGAKFPDGGQRFNRAVEAVSQ